MVVMTYSATSSVQDRVQQHGLTKPTHNDGLQPPERDQKSNAKARPARAEDGTDVATRARHCSVERTSKWDVEARG
jgi:hypothetical protein